MESNTKIQEGASTTPELDTEQVPLTLNSLKAKSRSSKVYKSSASISQQKNQLSNQETSMKNLGLTPAVLLPKGFGTIKELQHMYREKKKIKVCKTYEMIYGSIYSSSRPFPSLFFSLRRDNCSDNDTRFRVYYLRIPRWDHQYL